LAWHLQKPQQKVRVQCKKIQKTEVEAVDASLAHQAWLALQLLRKEERYLLGPKEIGLIRNNKSLWYVSD